MQYLAEQRYTSGWGLSLAGGFAGTMVNTAVNNALEGYDNTLYSSLLNQGVTNTFDLIGSAINGGITGDWSGFGSSLGNAFDMSTAMYNANMSIVQSGLGEMATEGGKSWRETTLEGQKLQIRQGQWAALMRGDKDSWENICADIAIEDLEPGTNALSGFNGGRKTITYDSGLFGAGLDQQNLMAVLSAHEGQRKYGENDLDSETERAVIAHSLMAMNIAGEYGAGWMDSRLMTDIGVLLSGNMEAFSNYVANTYDSSDKYWKIKKDGTIEYDGSLTKFVDEDGNPIKDGFANAASALAWATGKTEAEIRGDKNFRMAWKQDENGNWVWNTDKVTTFTMDKNVMSSINPKSSVSKTNATVKKESLLDSINNWFKGLFKGNDKPKTGKDVKDKADVKNNSVKFNYDSQDITTYTDNIKGFFEQNYTRNLRDPKDPNYKSDKEWYDNQGCTSINFIMRAVYTSTLSMKERKGYSLGETQRWLKDEMNLALSKKLIAYDGNPTIPGVRYGDILKGLTGKDFNVIIGSSLNNGLSPEKMYEYFEKYRSKMNDNGYVFCGRMKTALGKHTMNILDMQKEGNNYKVTWYDSVFRWGNGTSGLHSNESWEKFITNYDYTGLSEWYFAYPVE